MAKPIEEAREIEIPVATNERHIAIIDDDYLFSFMLQDYLLESGQFNSEIYSNGKDFLEKYNSNDLRVIILDYEFGENPNGLEILRKIKTLNPSAKVIIVSGVDDLEKAVETIRNGAVDYFLKLNTTVFNNILCSLNKLRDLEQQKWN